jgi:hypothetical protein
MARGKNLDQLRLLEDGVLAEVVREGELMMAAQLAAATAADQRGLTWAGFVLTIAIASIGACATLAVKGDHLPLAIITGILGVLMAISGFTAILSVRPRRFSIPGNRPENWLPAEWEKGQKQDLQQARIEQATCLNNQIDDNVALAEGAAGMMHTSMDLAASGVLLAGIYVVGYATWLLTTR